MMILLFLLLLSAALPGRAAERPCGSNICLNGGTCRVDDVARSFKCYCEKGFSGKLCQEVCSLPCVNGDCVKADHGQEICQCKAGWSGLVCDTSGGGSEGCLRDNDCPSSETCVEDDRGVKTCVADPCRLTPCQNNATCVSRGDDFQCSCPQGYAGKRCDTDVNECELDPCRNGGTCINLDGSFECLCHERFIGRLCGDTHCDPNPCLNNGSCLEAIDGGYQCLCDDGFSGKTCAEIDNSSPLIETPDICRSIPCLNGGTCVSNGTVYNCYCRPEFTGAHCENQTECTVGGQKCLNGGSCVRGLATSFCECPLDYHGILCEVIEMPAEDFCAQRPCANGGTCTVSNGRAVCSCPLGFQGPTCAASVLSSACVPNPCQNEGKCEPVGDPAEGGYICRCLPEFSGLGCEAVKTEWISSVSELPSPSTSPVPTLPTVTAPKPTAAPHTGSQLYSCENCVNSDKCIEGSEGAICICQEGNYGPFCDKEGFVCSSITCPAAQLCRPRISALESVTNCGCPIGKEGERCNKDNTVTFGPNSLFVFQSPAVMIGSSSGPLPYSISFAFRTTVPGVHLASGENIFGQRLFSIYLDEGRLSVNISGTVYDRLLSVALNDGEWYTLEMQKTAKDVSVSVVDKRGYEYLSRSLPRPSAFDIFSTRIGKTADEQFFIGCMADVHIDKTSVDLANSNRAVAITAGCSRIPQCAGNRCHNGGVCVDMWNHSECDCKAPFLPPLCMHSLPPSTFGHRDLSSHAEIAVPSESSDLLKFQTDIKLIIRTNKGVGAVLYIGENSAEDAATFIALGIDNGTLIVKSKIGSKNAFELRSRRRLDDNEDHETRVERAKRRVRLYVDGVLEAEGDILSRFDHPLFVERIQLGSSEGTAADAFASREYFKGSLQDVRINGESAILHRTELNVDGLGRVTRLENVLEGSISDDICSAGNLCVKGSCHNTFNDYECICNLGYYGRNCDQKDYCVSSPCPSGGSCINVGGGFICTSAVTLVRTSLLGFKLQTNESVELDSIDFSIRTHSQEGRILTLSTSTSRLMLALSYGQLVVTADAPFTIRKTISDGNWNRIRIEGNVLKINNASFGLPPSFSLPSSGSTANLNIGQMGGTASFEGCIQNMQVGKLPRLSFYREEDLKIPSGLRYWKATSRRKVTTDCLSSPQCGAASPCLNGGLCADAWNQAVCQCPPGFTGPFCEVNFNDCENIDCGNGRCIDEVHNYRCQCQNGYEGISCNVTADNCARLPCQNNGYCTNGNGTFNCQCTGDWIGKTCSIKKPVSCSPSPCQNEGICSIDIRGLKCRCTPDFTGDFCEEPVNPCLQRPCHHGTCKSLPLGKHQCICDEGYSGVACVELRNECTAEICGGKGTCTAIWNGTMCNCGQGWRGRFCSEDVDECLAIPCENDGSCINVAGGYQCKCRKFYLGDRCEVEGSCLRSPCINGECIQLKHDEHTCSCKKGFEGLNCEQRIDYCKKSPCKNGATCESLIGEYVCHCIPGFNGANCEHDIDECVYGFCSNGSMCRDRVADYDCICEGTGFQGKNCTDDIDECSLPHSCLHGECTNTNGGYKCDCGKGFIGRRCSVLDPCVPDKFNRTTHSCVHGKCVNPGVRIEHGHETAIHECHCNRGFTGPTCVTKVEERRLIVLGYVLPYVAGGLVLLCLLGCILFVVVWKGKQAYHGHYSPSHQEVNGARLQMSHIIKLPPEERLI